MLATLLGANSATESPAGAGLRRLREAGAPGWRKDALAQLERRRNDPSPAPLTPSENDALIQEVVMITATPELSDSAWKPSPNVSSAWIDLEGGRSVELSDSGEIRVRDLATGTERLRRTSPPTPETQVIRWDARTGWLVSVDAAGRSQFRNLGSATPSPIAEVNGPRLAFASAAWVSVHPEFSRIAIPGPEEKQPELVLSPLPPQGETGIRHIPLPDNPNRFEFSPSGTRLAALCRNQPALWVIQPSLDQVEDRLELDGVPTDFGWMPDARRVVVSVPSGLRVADLQEKTVVPFAGEARDVSAIGVNGSGALIAIGTAQGRVEVWDFKAARRIVGTKLSEGPIHRIEWSPDSTQLSVHLKGAPIPRRISFSVSRDLVHYVPLGATVIQSSPSPEWVRWNRESVWVKRPHGGEIRIPAPDNLASVGLSANTAWLHLRCADGAVLEWSLDGLRQRLSRYGLAW